VRELLLLPGLRASMGEAARQRALTFQWDGTTRSFEHVLRSAVAGRRVSGVDEAVESRAAQDERTSVVELPLVDLRDVPDGQRVPY
jgi:hypothetical protein